MSTGIMAELAERYRVNQHSLLALVSGLTDEQLAWSPNTTTPSAGFHVWHLARWADYLQAIINGRGSQVWERQGLAAQWTLAAHGLGYAQTGMGMEAAEAADLPLPGRGRLLAYARSAFEAAQQAVARIDDGSFFDVYPGLQGENWHDGQIGPIVITWMTHDNRHLGMIEALTGLQGIPGTADS